MDDERGARPPTPATVVSLQARMPQALHGRLVALAVERKESLNSLIVAILRAAAEARDGGTSCDTVIRPGRG